MKTRERSREKRDCQRRLFSFSPSTSISFFSSIWSVRRLHPLKKSLTASSLRSWSSLVSDQADRLHLLRTQRKELQSASHATTDMKSSFPFHGNETKKRKKRWETMRRSPCLYWKSMRDRLCTTLWRYRNTDSKAALYSGLGNRTSTRNRWTSWKCTGRGGEKGGSFGSSLD